MKKKREFYTFRGYQLHKEEHEQITASMEDYLEMIYRLSEKEGYVRVNQLAEKLNVQAPSVSRVAKKLAALGMLDYQRYGLILLTDKGKTAGSFLLNRHLIIEKFLRTIGVDEELILQDTEMIEHHLSINALQNIDLLCRFLSSNPAVLKKFRRYKHFEESFDS